MKDIHKTLLAKRIYLAMVCGMLFTVGGQYSTAEAEKIITPLFKKTVYSFLPISVSTKREICSPLIKDCFPHLQQAVEEGDILASL